MNYYNEHDPKVAAWLRELIKQNLIAPGIIDERSIVDVRANDLNEFVQCHFFAGIGVWSYALRSAGWNDNRPVWTGSCPCQPFSAAGKGLGVEDERHLWPEFKRLIAECIPPVVFGEQVASKAGRLWLNSVRLDLEDVGYGVGAADLCAAGVGAPHIRQRLYFVSKRLGHPSSERFSKQFSIGKISYDQSRTFERKAIKRRDNLGGVADPKSQRSGERQQDSGRCLERGTEKQGAELVGDGEFGSLANSSNSSEFGSEPRPIERGLPPEIERNCSVWASPTNGFWRNSDWLFCRDGKWRPVEPGAFPLAHGASARVGRLRGYGNAICAPLAQAFIESYMSI